MTSVRSTIELWFDNLGRTLFRHKYKSLLLVILFTGALLSQLPNLVIDTRNEAFFLKGDDVLTKYDEFRDQFGKDESFMIAIQPPDVFTFKFLDKLKRFHEELEEQIPYVDEISSLINARDTRGQGDELLVGDLTADWPETEADLAALKKRVMNNPQYINLLISERGDFTAIILKPDVYVTEETDDVLAGFDDDPVAEASEREFLSNKQYTEMAAAVRDVVDRYESDDFKVYAAGLPVITDAMDRSIKDTMVKLVPVSYLLILIFLMVMFRRISGVIYPIIVVTFGLLGTIGAMPLLRVTLNNLSTIIPTFITVVGIADSVHVMALFYREYNVNGGDKEAAVGYAMGHSGLAILMTSCTTAGGLLSFMVADVGPVKEFGLITPVGVMMVFAYSVILLPVLIAIFPIAKPTTKSEKRTARMDSILSAIGSYSCRNPYKIIVISSVIIVLSFMGISRLHFSHNALVWFPEDHPVRVATHVIDKEMAGAVALEVVIDTGKPNGLYDPGLLKQISDSVEFCENLTVKGEEIVGKAWSLDGIVKEIHQALNENRPEFYQIPDNRELIAQELLLFENSGSDDLETIVDTEFRKVRFTIKAHFKDAFEYKPLLDDVQQHFEKNYPNEDVIITGEMALIIQMLVNVIKTMAKSYGISLVVITFLMMLLIGRVRIGLLSMVPNLVPLIIVGGIMGWMNVPLDFSSMLTGGVAIGLVVDDTIHFMHNFRRYYEEHNDVKVAIHHTMLVAGRAILITSVVLSAAFFSYIVADMMSTVYFGMIVGGAVVMALLSDFFLTPALMTVAYRKVK